MTPVAVKSTAVSILLVPVVATRRQDSAEWPTGLVYTSLQVFELQALMTE